jgi:hypothetical protein
MEKLRKTSEDELK